jgi:hypothetical protein
VDGQGPKLRRLWDLCNENAGGEHAGKEPHLDGDADRSLAGAQMTQDA